MPIDTYLTISAVLAVFVFFASVTIFTDVQSNKH